nr:hypothetical protein [Tanacetum cinerariifolium]
SSKAFRVYNTRTRKVEENLHIRFLENKPMIERNGLKWLFDFNSFTQSINYVPVATSTISDESAGTQGDLNAGTSSGKEATSQDYIVMPIWKDASYFDSPLKDVEDGPHNEDDDKDKSEDDSSPKEFNAAWQHVNTASLEVNTGRFELNTVDPSLNTSSSSNLQSPIDMFKLGASDTLKATHVEFFSDKDVPKVDLGNIPNSYEVPTTSHTRIHKDHLINNVIGEVKLNPQALHAGRTSAIQAPIDVKSASTLVDLENPLVKDGDANDIDVHLYRSMIGSLMYLTTSRTNIMFAETASSSTFENRDIEITPATIDGRVKSITEASIRRHLKLKDSKGISNLPNTEIFEQLALMGIFKFSKMIFKGMLKNLDNKSKILIYPRFIQIFLNKHKRLLKPHISTYVAPTLTQKLFSNMRRASKGYSGVDVPLFPTMLVQGPILQSEPKILPPPILSPSRVPTPLHDSPLSGGNTPGSEEGRMTLNKLTVLYTSLSKKVESLESDLKQTKLTYSAAYSKLIMKFTIKERTKLLAEFFKRRKKQLAAKRSEAIRNKPPTRTQVRNKMITYLKHMGKYTHQQLKHKSLEELQKLYQKEQNWIDDFKPMDDDSQQQVESSIKRQREVSDEESFKKQKLEEDNDAEKEELRVILDIVPRDDSAINIESLVTKYPIVDWKTYILTDNMMYYQIIRADGSSKNYKIFSKMLDDFDRQDVIDLHRLKNTRNQGIRDGDSRWRFLWVGCLRLRLTICWHKVIHNGYRKGIVNLHPKHSHSLISVEFREDPLLLKDLVEGPVESPVEGHIEGPVKGHVKGATEGPSLDPKSQSISTYKCGWNLVGQTRLVNGHYLHNCHL